MPNNFEYAKVFQSELDRNMLQELTSGWMEIDDKLVQYTGGDEIKIPILDMDGLGDYDPDGDGFVDGAINLKWQTVKMEMDRGRRFTFDEHDTSRTGFVMTAPAVMGEFQRTKVVPEVDAYRYSKLATTAIANGNTRENFTASESNILKALYTDIAEVQDIVGDTVPLIITMSTKVAALFDLSDRLTKTLSVIDFKQGNVTLKVDAINGTHPIRRVSSQRMKTKYIFNDGKTAGQEKGGFKVADDALDINWIICPRDAIRAKAVTDAMRIFDPNTYQPKRAWAVDYRKYHDAWVRNSRSDTIRVSLAPAKSV